ncbi:MAG: dTDP-4-dehydrorhamnose reductase [Candidatus Azambacteria bacterium]|nr:dTDP-4-dehydrorhamnose reductase [Candidatus Azambacteria bacterium]
MKKVLITGANGQLAFDLIRIFSDGYEVIKAVHDDFDVADKIATENFIKNCAPDIVINTAAYHKIEECELNPERSFAVNAIGAFNVSKAAAAIGAKIIFFSTDYVFDGSKEYFIESDTPNPLNVYSSSKLAGENLTKIANENHYVIRTGWLFGVHQSGKGYNFVGLMLEKAKNGGVIKVVNDQFGSPTYSYDLAVKIKELIDKKAPPGIYHMTNGGFCSWYEFAKKIFELGEIKADIAPVSSQEYPSNIKRPKCSVLKNESLKKQNIEILRPWQEALGAFMLEYNKK